jgi:arginyl-tRNA synthetase
MLTRKNDAPLDFDFDKILEQSRTNPVFYVQYACARIRSVFRNVAAEGLESCTNDPEHAVFKRLSEPLELVLIKKIAFWPRIIEQSTKAYEPHRIAFYLYELSGCIHELWDCGRKNSDIRFIRKDDTELTRARLALLQAAERVLHLGLKILGVTPVQEM